MGFEIKTITAFIHKDENNIEGVLAFYDGRGWLPLVCADETRIKQMFFAAEEMKAISGRDYRIVQFSVRTDITEQVKEKYLK